MVMTKERRQVLENLISEYAQSVYDLARFEIETDSPAWSHLRVHAPEVNQSVQDSRASLVAFIEGLLP